MPKYKPQTLKELYKLTEDENIYLGDIDTSLITDMSGLFSGSKRKDFSGIETWDTSNVVNMNSMFSFASNFNHNINNWNVSNVENMGYMFRDATKFNQPLDKWNVHKVKIMNYMFNDAFSFNQDISSWNVESVKDMSYMFRGCSKFNQPLNSWNVSNVENMYCMFVQALEFNQPLNDWDISNVKDTSYMFYLASKFNQPLDKWNVNKVKNMSYMFGGTYNFNQYDSLENWDISQVNSMENIFQFCNNFKNFKNLKWTLYLHVLDNYYYGNDIIKDNLKEIYKISSKSKNKKIIAFKKRLENIYYDELKDLAECVTFKGIEEAENYAENNLNKKDEKKVDFIKEARVLIKDKSREADIKVIKYIYLKYLELKKYIYRIIEIDSIIDLFDKESFLNFAYNIYKETNKETAQLIYGLYGGSLEEIYKKDGESKLFFKILSLNKENEYTIKILFNIYNNAKKMATKNNALDILIEIAKDKKIPFYNLELKYNSNIGFDKNSEKMIDENYKLILNNDYSVSIFDIKMNKILKSIPRSLDNNKKEEIKHIREEVSNMIKKFSYILNKLLIAGDKYDYNFFKEVFIDNPIMNKFDLSLIWNLYDNNFITTFRYAGDGSYTNSDDEEIKIDDNTFISLASPIEMKEETITKWKKQLEDYELSQPINQLNIIKLDKNNLENEINKLQNIEIAYGTFKAFGMRYGMMSSYTEYRTIKEYNLSLDNGDTFIIKAQIDGEADYKDKVKINIEFKNDENKEVSKRFIYTILVFMILYFRLTNLF
ncbi:BspA family leucine-rich repeat surface protein [Brachyspira innocens]|uniref:BspA family leucine-rich repeat surface protein n=1 Tax=Brachyspira innocens TaxID=13264 RepID=A0ABT8YZM8_9SPIR|nr:BspA family leucine-rich repeat surface protein [Brachyspira innocens]MDO6993625.1 BspA family leucine-rich repeat surface protein [Brachyspira innocens]MDO7020375.1 BspA family leucine-rich repeat surface protein [Brachyspira innocens]